MIYKKFQKITFQLVCASLLISSCSMKTKAPDSQVSEEVQFRDPSSIFDGKITPDFFIPTDADITKAPSATLDLEKGEMIFDNYRAYLAKLNMIRNAKDSIDMVYYIWSNDVTSSLITHEVVMAAKRGVRVRILVDAFSSYKDLDFFRNLQSRDKNIQVKFYNLPSKGFLEQAFYITTSCPQEAIVQNRCAEFKKNSYVNLMKKLGTRADSFKGFMEGLSSDQRADVGVYLSGVYGKNPMAMMFPIEDHIKAVFAAGTSKALSPEDKEGLKTLAKIYWTSRTGTPVERVGAYAKLYVGSLMKPALFEAIQEKAGSLIPVDLTAGPEEFLIADDARLSIEMPGEAWSFLTDYTHHKLLLVDNQKFVLGGRNIEDSYHTTRKEPVFGEQQSNKYLFQDTDFAGELKRPSKSMKDSYARLFDFAPMSLDVEQYYKYIPNDLVANAKRVSGTCKKRFPERTAEHRAERKKCAASPEVAKHFQDSYVERLEEVVGDYALMLQTARKKFQEVRGDSEPKYVMNMSSGEPITSSDWFRTIDKDDLTGGAKVHYLENLNWNRLNPSVRSFGSDPNADIRDNKNIQAVWKHSLKKVCEKKTGNRTVIINNAYFFPSADLLSTLANMVDGSWDCKGVEIFLLTNSFETTDLNIINLFARHAILAAFQHVRNSEGRGATFRAYEWKNLPGKEVVSLHTKSLIVGDDVIIGSANWDVRSHLMDTNNAIWFADAPKVAEKYRAWFFKHIGSATDVTKFWGSFTPRQLIDQDMKLIDMMASRWNAQAILNKKNPKRYDALKIRVTNMLNNAYREAYSFLSKKNVNSIKVEGKSLDSETGSAGVGVDLLRMFDNRESKKLENMKRFNNFYKPL